MMAKPLYRSFTEPVVYHKHSKNSSFIAKQKVGSQLLVEFVAVQVGHKSCKFTPVVIIKLISKVT